MKKVLLFCYIISSIILCNSCKQNNEDFINNISDNTHKSEIAKNIQNLKDAGLLDNLLSSARNSSDDEIAYIQDFINNTDEVLQKINESEDGEKEIAIINALFNESDIDSFAETFSSINQEKADDFLDFINTNLITTNNSETNRSANNENNNIKLLYANNASTNRAIYASDLEWSTIGWYTGFCASTIAGFYLLSYGGFWLKIAGTIAATAGTASMIAQLIKWNNCSDLGTFISSLANKDSKTATKILNSENGVKILTITTETSATIVACYLTTIGKTIVQTVVYYINLILEKVIAILPAGIDFTINGIPLKLITL